MAESEPRFQITSLTILKFILYLTTVNQVPHRIMIDLGGRHKLGYNSLNFNNLLGAFRNTFFISAINESTKGKCNITVSA